MAPSPPNSDRSKERKKTPPDDINIAVNADRIRKKPKENHETALDKRKAGEPACGENQENQALKKEREFMCAMNNMFQHHQFCKDKDCKTCSKVEKLHNHLSLCNSNECSKCQWLEKTLKYHKEICHLPNCDLCAEKVLVPTENPVPIDLAHSSANACLDFESERICYDVIRMDLVGKNFREGLEYERGDTLGAGGNGEVFDAMLLESSLPCAIQKLNLAVKLTTVSSTEIKVLEKIFEFPQYFVQHYFVVCKEEEVTWKEKTRLIHNRLFLEKCDMSLSELRRSKPGGVLSIEEAKFYWIQILCCVKCLHNLNPPIMHKDIKSGNVLLTRETNSVRLTDFEYAIVLNGDVKTEHLRPCGTAFFVSPEVKQRKCHGTSADMYSMGAFFLELITTNRDRVNGDKGQEIKDRMVKKLKEVEREFGFLVESCLQEDPSDRPTALELFNHKIVQKYIRTVSLPAFMNPMMPEGV